MPDEFDFENPRSKNEYYLAAALGYYDGELPEPYTREDRYLKEIAENGTHQSGGGILVQTIDQTTPALTTTRPDGSALENEDYIKPKTSAEFPFDIGGFTIDNKFTRLLWFNGEWILDAGLIQDSSEVPLKDQVKESLVEDDPTKLCKNQMQVNIEQKKVLLDLLKQHQPDRDVTAPDIVMSKGERYILFKKGATPYKPALTYSAKRTTADIKTITLYREAVALQSKTEGVKTGGEFQFTDTIAADSTYKCEVTDIYGVKYESELLKAKIVLPCKAGYNGALEELPLSVDGTNTVIFNCLYDRPVYYCPKDFGYLTSILASAEGGSYENYIDSFAVYEDGDYYVYEMRNPVGLHNYIFKFIQE